MPKAISCGFIIFARETGEILACHPTGRPEGPEMTHDIPKGHLEEGEQPFETALRELKEETGLELPEGAPVHEIGLVPYQKQKSLYLFSTSLPKAMLAPEKLHCDSKFVDSFGNSKTEIDHYTLTRDSGLFFKNLQPYVKQEAARATMPEAVCLVRGNDAETGGEVLMRVSQNELVARMYRDVIVRIKDDNVYPNGYSADVEVGNGTIVSVDMDSLHEDLVGNYARVDVDGSVSAMPEFPIGQWFEQANSEQEY